MNELKPCPFCGSDDLTPEDYGDKSSCFYIRCFECLCRGPQAANEAEAAELWNKTPREREPEK